MFEDGKQPVDVCIALQINFEEARQYCHEYRLLRGEEDLPKVSDILGRDLVTIRRSLQKNDVRIIALTI